MEKLDWDEKTPDPHAMIKVKVALVLIVVTLITTIIGGYLAGTREESPQHCGTVGVPPAPAVHCTP